MQPHTSAHKFDDAPRGDLFTVSISTNNQFLHLRRIRFSSNNQFIEQLSIYLRSGTWQPLAASSGSRLLAGASGNSWRPLAASVCFWRHPGGPPGGPWRPPGGLWAPLGASGGLLGASGGLMAASGRLWGASWGLLDASGVILGFPGGLLVASGGLWRPPGGLWQLLAACGDPYQNDKKETLNMNPTRQNRNPEYVPRAGSYMNPNRVHI